MTLVKGVRASGPHRCLSERGIPAPIRRPGVTAAVGYSLPLSMGPAPGTASAASLRPRGFPPAAARPRPARSFLALLRRPAGSRPRVAGLPPRRRRRELNSDVPTRGPSAVLPAPLGASCNCGGILRGVHAAALAGRASLAPLRRLRMCPPSRFGRTDAFSHCPSMAGRCRGRPDGRLSIVPFRRAIIVSLPPGRSPAGDVGILPIGAAGIVPAPHAGDPAGCPHRTSEGRPVPECPVLPSPKRQPKPNDPTDRRRDLNLRGGRHPCRRWSSASCRRVSPSQPEPNGNRHTHMPLQTA